MNITARHACLAALLSIASLPALARHHGHRGANGQVPDSQNVQASAQGTAGQFDYYLMSLSWSPTYCLTHPGDTAQCAGKGYGFVLHGLWPQYAGGGYPQDCASADKLTPEAIALGQTIFPSPKLIGHEWSKHGTCSGLSALAYFKTADQAFASVHVPDTLQAPAQTLEMSANAIAQAFVQANPGLLNAASITVNCSGPELSEVRICLSSGLQAQACGKGVKNSCRAGNIRIPASR